MLLKTSTWIQVLFRSSSIKHPLSARYCNSIMMLVDVEAERAAAPLQMNRLLFTASEKKKKVWSDSHQSPPFKKKKTTDISSHDFISYTFSPCTPGLHQQVRLRGKHNVKQTVCDEHTFRTVIQLSSSIQWHSEECPHNNRHGIR